MTSADLLPCGRRAINCIQRSLPILLAEIKAWDSDPVERTPRINGPGRMLIADTNNYKLENAPRLLFPWTVTGSL